MTDIQLLKVTELLNQHGDLIVETGRDNSDFMLWFESDRFILIDKFGNEAWHLNGELHRTDGPAYIGQPDSKGNPGTILWYQNGELHPPHRPPGEDVDPNEKWTLMGRDWYLNDVKFIEEE
jgi:hypothetical protein